jgi:hypothetical protein
MQSYILIGVIFHYIPTLWGFVLKTVEGGISEIWSLCSIIDDSSKLETKQMAQSQSFRILLLKHTNYKHQILFQDLLIHNKQT